MIEGQFRKLKLRAQSIWPVWVMEKVQETGSCAASQLYRLSTRMRRALQEPRCCTKPEKDGNTEFFFAVAFPDGIHYALCPTLPSLVPRLDPTRAESGVWGRDYTLPGWQEVGLNRTGQLSNSFYRGNLFRTVYTNVQMYCNNSPPTTHYLSSLLASQLVPLSLICLPLKT